MTGIFIEYIRRGLPQSIDCMPNAGLTAPATGAGDPGDRDREISTRTRDGLMTAPENKSR